MHIEHLIMEGDLFRDCIQLNETKASKMIPRWPLKNAMYCHLNDHKYTNETRVNAADKQ